MSERFVFLHGGPGFNSFPEQALLAPLFEASGHEIAFWNEPSRLRPEGDVFEVDHAFERWVCSAERFVLRAPAPAHLIAHCGAALAAFEIVRRHPGRLATVALLAPSVDSFIAYRNILGVAHGDFMESQPELASAIATALGRTRTLFDAPMREGLMLAARDERLLTHYFADTGQLRAAAGAWAAPNAQFDPESFLAVLSDFASRGDTLLSGEPLTVPVLALFGSADPVSRVEEQGPALRASVPHVHVECIDGCSHYLHLDRPQWFVEFLLNWVRRG